MQQSNVLFKFNGRLTREIQKRLADNVVDIDTALAQRGEMKLYPVRPLDDFLLGSARFQLPNYKDLEKWGYRVVQNLLYYQTNYFIIGIIMFVSISLLQPLKMILGALSVTIVYEWFSCSWMVTSFRFKEQHPVLSKILIFIVGCLIVYIIGSPVVFLFAVLLPTSCIFVHASLRLRNIKNKLSNIERLMIHTTPMGVLLEELGMGPDVMYLHKLQGEY